ncbi:hypothetical protein DFJ74DRAFT_703284 [Hyaloraphidium curvatum]|nr:hypothetical protein DFJ74DRAFT_703284 [Hyaloraphidium curvatum]
MRAVPSALRRRSIHPTLVDPQPWSERVPNENHGVHRPHDRHYLSFGLEASLEAVRLNNLGGKHASAGRYGLAIDAFNRALEIKERIYGKISKARAVAEEMLAIAERIGSAEQKRIAKEILADIAKLLGGNAKPMNAKDDSKESTVLSAEKGATISVEPPTRRCFNPRCPHSTINGAPVPNADGTERQFLRCSRCKRVYYCGAQCQRQAWAEHKRSCE